MVPLCVRTLGGHGKVTILYADVRMACSSAALATLGQDRRWRPLSNVLPPCCGVCKEGFLDPILCNLRNPCLHMEDEPVPRIVADGASRNAEHTKTGTSELIECASRSPQQQYWSQWWRGACTCTCVPPQAERRLLRVVRDDRSALGQLVVLAVGSGMYHMLRGDVDPGAPRPRGNAVTAALLPRFGAA